jgi:hypothetical protein
MVIPLGRRVVVKEAQEFAQPLPGQEFFTRVVVVVELTTTVRRFQFHH